MAAMATRALGPSLVVPRIVGRPCPCIPGGGSSSSGSSAEQRQLSKRREKSAGHLSGLVSCVSEHLGQCTSERKNLGSPPAAQDSLPTIAEVAYHPQKLNRRNVSLRFPRTGSGSKVEHDDVEGVSSLALKEKVPTDVSEEMEDLRLQNATLRSSLATLQQSVIESMKGDKAQFVGGGIFKARAAPATDCATRAKQQASRAPAIAAQQDADIECLRTALAERRAALRTALAERDAALAEADTARREVAELMQRNETLTSELNACYVRLEGADGAREKAEADREAFEAQVATLGEKAEQLRAKESLMREELATATANIADLRQSLTESQERCTSVAVAHEASLARHVETQAQHDFDLARLQTALSSDRHEIAKLVAQQKALSLEKTHTMFEQDDSLKRVCFSVWIALCATQREMHLSERFQKLESSVNCLVDASRVANDEMQKIQAKAASAEEQMLAAQEKASHWERRAGEIEVQKASLLEQIESVQQLKRRDDDMATNELNKSEARISDLEEELKQARAEVGDIANQRDLCLQEAALAADVATLAAREATEREASLRRELEASIAHAKNVESSSTVDHDAEARETCLRSELESCKKTIMRLQEVEDAARRELEDAKCKIVQSETQQRALKNELTALRAASGQSAQEAEMAQRRAQVAESRASEAEKHAKELQLNAIGLQTRIATLESDKALCEQREEESTRAKVTEATKRVVEQADCLMQEKATLASDLSDAKLSLAEARSNAKSASEQLRQIRQENDVLKVALEEAKVANAEAEKRSQSRLDFDADVRRAVEEARQGIRIMVTAPKVSVNLGKTETQLHNPFPFAAIKEAVQKEVMPQFTRIFSVGAELGDSEIRTDVQAMVHEFAITLQTKVHELLPQAEGTCNWDGFGAKSTALGAR